MLIMRALLLTPFLLLLQLDLICSQTSRKLSRDDFPLDFVFGAGTSAYQVEGAAAEDGRTPSVWDTYTHAGKMADKSNGDVASDQYHKYKEDVKLMSDTGLEAYRFSISWSRLIPNGRGDVNPKGLNYYNNLIDELVRNGIQPHVTLLHLDTPQVLEDEYKSWLNPKIVDDFRAYAEVCFREFGDRVAHWTTMAEPNIISMAGYDIGSFPPCRCSSPFGVDCSAGGDSTTEPYIVVHNVLLAHAAAVQLYRDKYQALQKGKIGLNVYTFWCSPLTSSVADAQASIRVMEFILGWIVDPLVFGDYPASMKENAGRRLPVFSKSQSKQVKGSFDFIGLNHYFTVYAADNSDAATITLRDFSADMFASLAVSKNDTPGGSAFMPTNLPVDPLGLKNVIEYIKEKYGNPPIYIQENGYGLGIKDSINDTDRMNYLSSYMASALDAIRNGSNVRGYFVWSFMDVFEFLAGYKSGFGLYHVDFKDKERKRLPKLSAHWYSYFLSGRRTKWMPMQTLPPLHPSSSSSSSF